MHTAQLSTLPSEVATLQASVEKLQKAQAVDPANPSFSLPLPEIQSLLANQENELLHLDTQIAMLQASIPRKTKELDRLERELEPLEIQKNGVVAAAKEARRRRDEGEAGIGDGLEQRGRWLRAVDKGLVEMLGVEG
jgi:chromosome segregation ATPase